MACAASTKGYDMDATSASPDLLPGTIVCGDLCIEQLLGRGGLAAAYEVRQQSTGRSLTLKLAHRSTNKTLRVEADLFKALDSPEIGTLYDFGTLPDGRPYLVRGLVRGETLYSFLRWGVGSVLQIATRIGTLLATLHRKRILHRDVKPGNIIVPQLNDRPYFADARLIDFDFARSMDVSCPVQLECAGPGDPLGTVRYMAPEILQGRIPTEASDTYGLGVTLYEMLCGYTPMVEERVDRLSSVLGVRRVYIGPFVLRKINEDVHLPSDPAIPRDLRDLIERMLSREPRTRPSLTDEVIPHCEATLSTAD
jgi:serine/threonine-protein kinase